MSYRVNRLFDAVINQVSAEHRDCSDEDAERFVDEMTPLELLMKIGEALQEFDS